MDGKAGAESLLRDAALASDNVAEIPVAMAESHEFDPEMWIALVSMPVRDCWLLLPEEMPDDGSG